MRAVKIAQILLWLTAAVLAALVGASSAVITNQFKHPARSAAIGVGPMGHVNANLAYLSYARRQNEDSAALTSIHERQLALAAYRTEPLSSAALGVLAVSRHADGRKKRALLDLAGRLTRRSSLITSQLIEVVGRSGDDSSVFLWMSRAILTNEAMQSAYIDALAKATARPGAAAGLAPHIGSNPSWSDRYWRAVANVPASLENAAELRALVAGAPWRQTEISDADRRLLIRLLDYGHFDTARRMATAISRNGLKPAVDGAVVNAAFSKRSILPPIDWEVTSSGNMGATVDSERQQLVISAIAGARGYAARQLMLLTPGTYEMEWRLSADGSLENDALTARVGCAEKASTHPTYAVSLRDGHRRVLLTIQNSDCRWYWLSINVNVPDGSEGIDAQLRRLNLRRVE